MAGQFTRCIAQFRVDALKAIDTIHKESTAELIVLANTPKTEGGNTPIDTGYMIASIIGGSAGGLPAQGNDALLAVLQVADPFVEFRFGWEAFYAPFVEYGTSRQDPQPFARPAAEMWPSIVAQVTARVCVNEL